VSASGIVLGPLTFISLVSGLNAADMTHRHVDDTTLTELLHELSISNMLSYVDEIIQQTAKIRFSVKKTKDVFVGRAGNVSIPQVVFSSVPTCE